MTTRKTKKRNKEVMDEAGQTRWLVNEIKIWQADVIGHIMKRKGLEHLIPYGTAQKKRRQGKTLNDGQTCSTDKNIEKTMSVISANRDREVWKAMVVKAGEIRQLIVNVIADWKDKQKVRYLHAYHINKWIDNEMFFY